MTINVHDEDLDVVLLPCVCGNENIEVWDIYDSPGAVECRHYLSCYDCKLTAPIGDTLTDAILLWDATVEDAAEND